MLNILSGWRNSLSVIVGNIVKSKDEAREWSKSQTFLALGFALAACCELKIDSCPMEGFDAEAFQKELDLPDHIMPVALMAVGTRDPEDKIFPKTRFPEEDLFTMYQ